jgi:hypothetical protein
LRTDTQGAIWFTAKQNPTAFDVHRASDYLPQALSLVRYGWRAEADNAFRLVKQWGGLF